MSYANVSVGQHIKVFLPGESPWAIVTAVPSNGRVVARIDNHPVGNLHGYKYGDVATFHVDEEYGCWVLAPLDKQVAIGPRSMSEI